MTFGSNQAVVACLHRGAPIHWMFLIRRELGEVFFCLFWNLLNGVWRMVRFNMYVLDYVSLQSIITSRPLSLNYFGRSFFMLSYYWILHFLKIESPSSLYETSLSLLYCCSNKFNEKTPIISHTSKPSLISIKTSNRSPHFFIHVNSWLLHKIFILS